VGLLREIYTTRLVPFQQQQQQQQTASSSIYGEPDDVERDGVVDAVGRLIDTVALIGDELAERTHIERLSVTGESNVNVRNVSAVVVTRPAGGRRYSHADDLFQAAHIFHLCSIIILGFFVVEVGNRSSTTIAWSVDAEIKYQSLTKTYIEMRMSALTIAETICSPSSSLMWHVLEAIFNQV